MDWQEEFITTFYKVIKKENVALNKLNKNINRDSCYPCGVIDLKERQWQYLLFKGLLANNYYDRWIIRLEQPYSDKRHAKSRKLHVDFTLTETKYRKADHDSQICLEMKGSLKEAKDDYKRLKQYSNICGLLIYKFGKRPVKLETKINESPEFKKLMNKLKIITPGDMKVNVVNKGGNYERYHFEAVLLSW